MSKILPLKHKNYHFDLLSKPLTSTFSESQVVMGGLWGGQGTARHNFDPFSRESTNHHQIFKWPVKL